MNVNSPQNFPEIVTLVILCLNIRTEDILEIPKHKKQVTKKWTKNKVNVKSFVCYKM